MTGAELEGNLRRAQSNCLKQPKLYGTKKKEKKKKCKWFLCFISMDNLNIYEFVHDIL